MDDQKKPFSEKIYRWLVLTPLAYIMEILLTAQILWMGFVVTFYTLSVDYQSALMLYLDRSFPQHSIHFIGILFIILGVINAIALLRRWRIPRVICIIVNIAYLLTYVGAAAIVRPLPIGIGITITVTVITILALFKLSNIRVYDSRIH